MLTHLPKANQLAKSAKPAQTAARPIKLRYILPLALGLLSMMPLRPVLAAEAMMRVLTVTGQGSETIATSLTQVQLGVEVQDTTAEKVQQEVARRSAAVVQLLRSRNVIKLQTTGINLNPVYSYENNRQRLTGYAGSNTVSFQVPTEQAGSILDDAVRAGASQINSVSFVAADEAIARAQSEALREAAQAAQAQADSVLATLGLNRQEIVGIQINNAVAPPPMPYMRAAAMEGAARDAVTPVVGGEQDVQASVTLQIRY
jgi:uncharacterized protein YggE